MIMLTIAITLATLATLSVVYGVITAVWYFKYYRSIMKEVYGYRDGDAQSLSFLLGPDTDVYIYNFKL